MLVEQVGQWIVIFWTDWNPLRLIFKSGSIYSLSSGNDLSAAVGIDQNSQIGDIIVENGWIWVILKT